MKYEYIVIPIDEHLQNNLNHYGEKGFKLISVIDNAVILMREIGLEEDYFDVI